MQHFDQFTDARDPSSRQLLGLEEGPKRTRPRVRRLYIEGETKNPPKSDRGIGSASSSGETCGSDTPRHDLPRYSAFPCRPGNYDPDPRPTHKSKSCSNIADLQRAIDHLYLNYRQCRECNSSDIVQVKDKHDSILLVWCRNCSHSFGVDDSMEPEVLLDLYRQGCIETTIGCCSNTNPDKFEIVGFDGSNLSVRCENCKKVSVMGEEQKSERVTSQDEPGVLVCACGNRDQEEMGVCLFRDEIRCVICNICDQYIDFPEILRCESETSGTHDPSEFVSCKCRPEKKNIAITRDDSGSPEIIACTNCQLYYLPKDPLVNKPKLNKLSASTAPSKQSWGSWLRSVTISWLPYLVQGMQANKDLKVRYREIHRLSELRRGDHIMWDRREGYGHHAIVEHVNPTNISVVHYNGPSPSSQKIKGKIVAEQLDPFGREHGRAFVVDYTNSLAPDTVIKNAYSKLGEVQYSLVVNNCEHFATWCKTGQHVSAQVMKVADCVKKYANMCSNFNSAMKGSAVPETFEKLAVKGLQAFAIPGVEKSAIQGFARYGAVAVMVGAQVYGCFQDIKQATEDRKEGNLSRDAYIEFVVSRVCQSVGGLAGLAFGLRVSCSELGGLVGGTLGGLIGEFAGKHIGKLAVLGYDEMGRAFGKKWL